MLEKIETKIIPRVSYEGHPFTELLHTYVVDGEVKYALSRINCGLPNNRYTEQAQNEGFRARFNRTVHQDP